MLTNGPSGGGREHAPRRLPRGARQAQLVAAALPLAARQGLAGLSLPDLAGRAGVTRNLLYHYFPRGKPDLALAVLREAERQLNDAWTGADGAARAEGRVGGILDHALAPTHAWRIHRQARFLPDRQTLALLADLDRARISLLVGSPQLAPSGAVQVALLGYLAFMETVLDEGRRQRRPRPELARILQIGLATTLDCA